jgi:hypothetical protein
VGFEQYQEPTGEINAEVRTFARMIASLTEEAVPGGRAANSALRETSSSAEAKER